MRLHAGTARAGLLFLLLLSLPLALLPRAAGAMPAGQQDEPEQLLTVTVGAETRQLPVLLADPWPGVATIQPQVEARVEEAPPQVSLTLLTPGDSTENLALLLFLPQGVTLAQAPDLDEVGAEALDAARLTARPDHSWLLPPPTQPSEEPVPLLLRLTVDESYPAGAPLQLSLVDEQRLLQPPTPNPRQPSGSLFPQLGLDEAAAGSGSARLMVSFSASNEQRALLFSLPAGLTAETSDPGLTRLQAGEPALRPPAFAGEEVSGWWVEPSEAQAELFTFQLDVAPDFGLGEPLRVALVRQEPASWWTVSALAPAEMNQLEAARQEPTAATAAAASPTAGLEATSTVTPTLTATAPVTAAPTETAAAPPPIGQPTATTTGPEVEATPAPGPLASLRENTAILIVLGALLLGLLVLLLVFLLRPRPAPAPSAPAAARPVASSGQPYLTLAGNDRRFPVNVEPFTIGRAPDNSLSIDESFPNGSTVSRYHAAIYRQGGQYVIEDRNSQNGIWVNGRATAKNLLRDGWQVSVGGVDFVFHLPGASR